MNVFKILSALLFASTLLITSTNLNAAAAGPEDTNNLAAGEYSCAICHDTNGAPVILQRVRLICGHSFHANCILNWTGTRINPVCPLCRTPVNRNGLLMALMLVFNRRELVPARRAIADERREVEKAQEAMQRSTRNLALIVAIAAFTVYQWYQQNYVRYQHSS